MNALQHSPEEVIRQLSIGLSVVTDPAVKQPWPAYHSGLPDVEPDNLVVFYGTAGRDDGFSQPDADREEMPGIQLAVRGNQHSTSYRKAEQLATALDAVNRVIVTLGTVIYLVHAVIRTSNVLSIGREHTSKRRMFTVNFVVSLELLQGA